MRLDINTAYWPKPIPTDRHDWQATYADYEAGDYVGHGATEAEAVADLVTNHPLSRGTTQ